MADLGEETIDPYSIPIDELDPSDHMLFHRNEHWAYFERLRKEDPVHFCNSKANGPFWSITRYNDIIEVDNSWQAFSSDFAVTLEEVHVRGVDENATEIGGMITHDPPDHDVQRKIVSPALAPSNLVRMEGIIRARMRRVFDALPLDEEFDWAETVSIPLTLLMLATLLDWPENDIGTLKRWSDFISGYPGDGVVESYEHREVVLKEMASAMLRLREERAAKPPASDLISMIAHSPAGAAMNDKVFVGNMGLLIVGGNDTTRNSMSAAVLGFDKYPEEWLKLKANPDLIPSAVPEIIRWHSPVMYQGRRATRDYELGGKIIPKGSKVAMWYVSGNRDETVIKDADRLIVDRERPRQHLSFGFGVHRCLGNRLGELQLRIYLEEILRQGWTCIEVTENPAFAISNMMRSIESMKVIIRE